MELTVLVENNCKIGYNYLGEPALSFLLENDYQKILFDCGNSDAFIKNAYKMGIDLTEISEIVLSHGHFDHSAGLLKLDVLFRKMLRAGVSLNHKIICAHPDVFLPKLDLHNENIGFPGTEKDLCNIFDIEYRKEPTWITPTLLYLGEVPKKYEVEYKYKDEVALIHKSSEGLVIICACCHFGIQNLIEYAQKVTGEDRIYMYIGGLHLVDKSEYKIREIGIYLKSLKIKHFYPCHCCDLNAKIILSEYLKIKEVHPGLKISIV